MDILLTVTVLAALAVLQSLLISRFGLKGFSYRREFSRREAAAGETVEYTEVIRNKGPLLLPWVRLESRMPASFEFRTREEVEIRSGRYHKSVFTLSTFCQVTRRHRVVLRQRGHYVLAQTALTMGDLLGLSPVIRDLDAPAEIYVYPAPPAEDPSVPASREQGEVSVPRWIQPDPFLVNGIRPYRPGDPERSVHWNATARTGEIQVKTMDHTSCPRLMVLINSQLRQDQWGELTEEEQPRVEQAISLAAALCLDALGKGMEAGFAANMPLDEDDADALMLPSRGTGWEAELLRAFACLRVRRTLRFPTFLSQLPPLPGTDILILSCYDSEDIREGMQRLAYAGASVSLRVLREGAS